MGFGATEILVIAGLILFFWGGKKIPELARGLGSGIRNFKGEVKAPPEDETRDDEAPR
jgi:sec-independent protein translocase protein TatA